MLVSSKHIRLIVLMPTLTALLCFNAEADWERSRHPAESVSPSSTQPTPSPVQSTSHGAASRPSRQGGTIPPHLYSPVLDAPAEPVYAYSLSYTAPADFGDYGSSGMIEFDAGTELAYFRNIIYGDIDIGAHLHTTVLTSSMDLNIPRYFSRILLETGWTWRFLNGVSFELRLFPGIYGELGASFGDLASVPTRLVLHRAIHPDLSGLVGIEVRPGWDLPIMPIGGFAWEPLDRLRFEVMAPRSRALLYLGPAVFFAGAEWRNFSYAIDQEESAPDQVTFDDMRLNVGTGWKINDELTVSLEAAWLTHRTLRADVVRDRKLDVDGAMGFRLTVSGPF